MLTLGVAQTLAALNPDMTFCYVSGAGTDSNEKGTGWAAVKDKTENDLMKLPFKQVFAFRPGFIKPISGQTRVNMLFKFIALMYPIGRTMFPGSFAQVKEIGEAMIKVTQDGYCAQVIEDEDIISLSKTA
ncbi:nucleoside-diphosphate sugar epimerase [Mucilaginibacter sp. RB4R14]|uniref:nucleoside-diphosphate sugar epimerase n=1 Tax=Mucilaginibacter aurantiaciroseus TaxID=2949308 RepID=UPI00209087C8|nr:nucleoside-diphosphate sugar epimerase [Mucilaginibacter aurantiaciroseus]MCO5934130.1 nucleoside-diphosphate sugar epimerase [Mucilaginibacter aurantiaciroseus]